MGGPAIAPDTRPLAPVADHPRRWSNGADKALTASCDRQLLAAVRANPTASASELARLLEIGKGSITGRWRRLSARGLLVKDRRGHWRAVERERPPSKAVDDDKEVSEFETRRSTSLYAYNPRIWLNHVNYFYDLVFNPSPFACRRYG
jgi:MarR family